MGTPLGQDGLPVCVDVPSTVGGGVCAHAKLSHLLGELPHALLGVKQQCHRGAAVTLNVMDRVEGEGSRALQGMDDGAFLPQHSFQHVVKASELHPEDRAQDFVDPEVHTGEERVSELVDVLAERNAAIVEDQCSLKDIPVVGD